MNIIANEVTVTADIQVTGHSEAEALEFFIKRLQEEMELATGRLYTLEA